MNATLEEFESTNIELQRKITELEETKKELEHNLAERRRAQEALNESQAEIMSLFEATPAGIGMLRQRQFRKVNSVMCRITGYSEEELLGNLTRMLYFNDGDYDRVGREFYDAIKKDGFGLTEVNLRHKDGSTINAMIGGSPVDPADVTKGVATVVFDVTRLKQTEEALRKSESEFRSLFNASPAGAVMLVDRVIMKANREMCRITGYAEDELLGMKTRIFYRTDEEYEKVGRELYGPMEATGLGMVEAVIYSREGNPVDVLICASPLDAADPSSGVAVTLLDITARKRMERELGKALEEKSRLMIEMQHRMKNSLAMIAGLISLEMNRWDNPAVKGVLESMSGRIRSLSSLNALLAGSDDVTMINLESYLMSIISNLSDIFTGRESSIAIQHRMSPVTVSARDASAWGLIANELMTNALKHAFPEKRSGLIVIELQQHDNEIELSVHDDGIGALTGVDLENSSGLGITMVKMLSEQLGGTLRYAGNGGNTFTVRVPRER
jgi:PAS domain S-box-containing protein